MLVSAYERFQLNSFPKANVISFISVPSSKDKYKVFRFFFKETRNVNQETVILQCRDALEPERQIRNFLFISRRYDTQLKSCLTCLLILFIYVFMIKFCLRNYSSTNTKSNGGVIIKVDKNQVI